MICRWKQTQHYHFERYDGAAYLMQKGMNPNIMSWQRVSLLHDMAQKGLVDKAKLLLSYGADLNLVDEAYQSTPLGLAARWRQAEMVEWLLYMGADSTKAGAEWATPLAWARRKGYSAIVGLLEENKEEDK